MDGKTYDVSLRYKHMYKPYSMHLVDVEQDVYMGTQTPESYSSHLRLVDPTRNVDRTVKIWMNNPLRFAGETFYQSNYGRDPRTGTEYTGLQVVTNTGWRIPVRLLHDAWRSACWPSSGSRCDGYLRRRAEAARRDPAIRHGQVAQRRGNRRRPAETSPRPADSRLRRSTSLAAWLVPLAVVVLSGLWLLSKAYTPAPRVGAIGPRRVRPLAGHVRGTHQADRYAGPQQSADHLRSPGVQGRERGDAAGDPLAVGRDHGLRRPPRSIGCFASRTWNCSTRWDSNGGRGSATRSTNLRRSWTCSASRCGRPA